VLDKLRAILRAPNLLGEVLPQAIKLDPTLDEAKITVDMTRQADPVGADPDHAPQRPQAGCPAKQSTTAT